MNRNSLVLALLASFMASSVIAGTMGPIIEEPDWLWVGTFSAGPVWENSGRTQTFYLTPEIEKSYVANSNSHTLFNGEIFAGLQKRLWQNAQAQFGLAVAATNNATPSGDIWDDADPEFNNYTYRYKIQHTHVAVKGKLLADMGCWVIPWVSGSLGVGFNNAHSFNNTPTIFEAVTTPNFSPHTKTTFSYTVGAGVQKALNANWQVGVGYEFADWGKSRLNSAFDQTLNSGLALNHLYTNGILFNLTYLI